MKAVYAVLAALCVALAAIVAFAAAGKLERVDVATFQPLAPSGVWTSPCTRITAPPWTVFAQTQGPATLAVTAYLDPLCRLPSGAADPAEPPLTLVKSPSCPGMLGFCGNAGGQTPAAAVKFTVTNTTTVANVLQIGALIHDPPDGEPRGTPECASPRYC